MMDEATKQASMTAIRAVLIAVGGILSAKGWASAEDVQLFVGAAMVIIPALWAVLASVRKAHKADEREAVALNVGIALSNESPGQTPPVPKGDAKAVIQTITEGTKP